MNNVAPPVTDATEAEPMAWRLAVQEACDLLAERRHGNASRSPSHNARLVLEAVLRASSVLKPADATEAEPVRRALAKLRWNYMPSHGEVRWQQLEEAVSEALFGDRTYRREISDRDLYVGHRKVGINFNSLNRIVSAFARAALASAPEAALRASAPKPADASGMTPLDHEAVLHAAAKIAETAHADPMWDHDHQVAERYGSNVAGLIRALPVPPTPTPPEGTREGESTPAPTPRRDASGEDEPFPKPQWRGPNAEPCGECHIKHGETCDICGARRAQPAGPDGGTVSEAEVDAAVEAWRLLQWPTNSTAMRVALEAARKATFAPGAEHD